MRRGALALMLLLGHQALASPCTGVDRNLSDMRKAELAPIVAKQFGSDSVDILQSYFYHGWYIIYVDTRNSDPAFLFYNGEPSKSHYVTAWGGAAGRDEKPEIVKWTLKNAVGIPSQLAECFASHVTQDRDL